MSRLSRLLGLIFAILPGLLFLSLSVMLFQRWPQLGMVTGPLYSLASFVTGATCLYLGIHILFSRDKTDEPVTPSVPLAPPVVEQSTFQEKTMQAAPLPVIAAVAPIAATPPETPLIVAPETAPAPIISPETRIRRIAQTRPNWQVTAPQLAHAANLKMAVADATARQMVSDGNAQMQIGPNGEVIYIFDLANEVN